MRLSPAARFDLVLAGTVMNELPEEARLPLVQRALAALRPGGAVVVIEPALRETSRDLHRIRDAALAAGAHVFAPCTRRVAPCPALEDDRDWCHEDRPTRLPPRAQQLATATGLRGGGLKFSYVVLRNEPGGLVPDDVHEGARRALRVVSQPRKLKGKLECFACGDGGRASLRRLGRARSDSNRALDRARRGDVVVVGERDDLDVDDVVERIEPATRRS